MPVNTPPPPPRSCRPIQRGVVLYEHPSPSLIRVMFFSGSDSTLVSFSFPSLQLSPPSAVVGEKQTQTTTNKPRGSCCFRWCRGPAYPGGRKFLCSSWACGQLKVQLFATNKQDYTEARVHLCLSRSHKWQPKAVVLKSASWLTKWSLSLFEQFYIQAWCCWMHCTAGCNCCIGFTLFTLYTTTNRCHPDQLRHMLQSVRIHRFNRLGQKMNNAAMVSEWKSPLLVSLLFTFSKQ